MARTHWTEWLADTLLCEQAEHDASTPEALIRASAKRMALLFDAMAPMIEKGELSADNDIHRRRWTQMKRMISEAMGINDTVLKDTDPE